MNDLLLHSAASSWLKVVPWGLRSLLNWIRKEYDNPELYITENGVSDHSGTLVDLERIQYYDAYINNVLKGMSSLFLTVCYVCVLSWSCVLIVLCCIER